MQDVVMDVNIMLKLSDGKYSMFLGTQRSWTLVESNFMDYSKKELFCSARDLYDDDDAHKENL